MNDSGDDMNASSSDSAAVNQLEPSSQEWLKLRAVRVQQIATVQRVMLSFRALSPLVRYLLEDLPLAIGAAKAELRLHDPDGQIAELLTISNLLGQALTLSSDSDPLYALYADAPEIALLGYDDARIFEILPGVDDIATAVVMPILDGNRLLASFHIGFGDAQDAPGPDELPLFSMLAQLAGAVVLRVLEQEGAEKLALLDPVTEVGSQRALRRDMLRETSWARRMDAPLSLLHICLDEFPELCAEYGEVAGNFMQRRVSQRLCSELRATDYMAFLSTGHFAVLLPSCSEPHAHDIGERMRGDIENLAIDDGRGAVLHVTLSIGMVCWEPSRHPVESNERLSAQMESEANNAMLAAGRGGRNQISVARLGLLML